VVGPLAEANALEPIMLAILLFSFVTFLVLFLYLLVERAALRGAEDQVWLLRFSMQKAGR
jgi:hypothetical protein